MTINDSRAGHSTGTKPPQLQKSGHFVVLDLYRFLAASGVVVLHYALIWPGSAFVSRTEGFYLFVDFFFILSGFVIAHSYASTVGNAPQIFTFLRRRFARIYPLHLVTLMLFLVPAVLGMTARSENIRVSELLAQLTLVNSWPLHAPLPYNYPAWSISVEWAMYLLFPLVMLLHRRAGIWSLVAVVMLGFAALEALLATDVFPAPVANNTPLRALPTFVIGILIALNYARFRFAGGVWIGLAAFVVSTALMTMHVSPYIVIALFSIAVLFTAGGEALRTPALFDNHICRMLGDASYSVYMLHAFILSLAVNFIWKRYGGSQEFPLVYGAVAVGSMVLALSLLTFRYFEKPMRDLISGRRARLARSNVALASQRDPFPLR